MPERRVTADGRILERQDDGSIIEVGRQGSNVPTVISLPTSQQDIQANARKDREEGYDRRDRSVDVASSLRKEFQATDIAKNYNIALGTYNSALTTKPTAEGDQSLIVSFARMLDPNSVVREGEFVVAASNEAAFTRLVNDIKRQFGVDGAGRLSPQGRARLRDEMRNLVVNRFKAPYDQMRTQYGGYAQAAGVEPGLVIGSPLEDAFPKGFLEPKKAEAPPQQAAPQMQLAAGETKAIPLPKEYQDEVNAYVAQNIGNLDPSQYAAFRVGLDRQYGIPTDFSYYVQNGQQLRSGYKGGQQPPPVAGFRQVTTSPAEQAINDFAGTKVGAATTTFGNSLLGGLPGYLSGNNEAVEAVRQNQPVAGFIGDLGGSVAGTLALGVAGRAAGLTGLAANPMAQNAAFGAVSGATQSEDPLTGAAFGAVGSLGGDIVGRYAGRALPELFAPGSMRAARESVPSSGDLGLQADRLYARAMTQGQSAPAPRVDQFVDDTEAFLRSNGIMTQQGQLLGSGQLQDATRLLQSFRGREMNPLEARTVRDTIAEGRMAMREGVPDNRTRMLSGDLTDQFDRFAEADGIMPGIAEAREVAQRRIIGRELQGARELGQARGEINYSQGSEDLGIRRAFGALDTADVRGARMYPEHVQEAIRIVSRGTPTRNLAQWIGRLSPQGGGGLYGGGALGGLVGTASGDVATGLGTTAALYTTGLFGRSLANRMARRDAEMSELVARGGPAFHSLLQQVAEEAAIRGGRAGAGALGSTAITPLRD